MAGLEPTLTAIKAHKKLALANKETLVAGGRLVMDTAARENVDILPVDFRTLGYISGSSGETF